jgi:hypothetical protein
VKAPGALGRPQALGVEALGDLGGRAPGGGEFRSALPEPGVVAQLGQAGDGAGDAARGAVAAGPGDLDVGLLADADHGDPHVLDQVPEQLLAVRVSCRRRVPHGRQAGRERPDLLPLGGGQGTGPGGEVTVVFCLSIRYQESLQTLTQPQVGLHRSQCPGQAT